MKKNEENFTNIEPGSHSFGLPGWANLPLVKKIFYEAEKLGGESRIVGGAVRNWLSGLPVDDIDMAINLPIGIVSAHLKKLGLKVIHSGIKYGSVVVIDGTNRVELTQTRSDLESNGRHAVVTLERDWSKDAIRRDFTINAIYLNKNGNLFDPLGGILDLKEKRLRFVGNANVRVKEDALRMLRYFRFLPRFLQNGVDPAALSAIKNNSVLCRALSGERVAREMRQIMVSDKINLLIKLIRETDIDQMALGVKFQNVPIPGDKNKQRVIPGFFEDLGWIAGLAAVIPQGKAVFLADRLRLSRAEKRELMILDRATDDEFFAMRGDKWRRCAYFWSSAAALYAVQLLRDGLTPSKKKINEILDWKPPKFPINGSDLLLGGVDNPAAVGHMLDEAEKYWVSLDFAPDKAALMTWLGNA